MLTAIKNKMRLGFQLRKKSNEYSENTIFEGSEENYIRNGARVLEESISLFHGRTDYLLRHYSIDDLNSMYLTEEDFYGIFGARVYQGCFDGRPVLIDKFNSCSYAYHRSISQGLHEVVVATKMGTHNNVHKLLGCCLETPCPVLIYEWVGTKTLTDCIFIKGGVQNKQLLEWKDRLRIAWEISHVLAYLHTAFPRPIIHRNLNPINILLDENNSAKLRDFSLSISLPEGQKFVEVVQVLGTYGYMAPEYAMTGKLSESADVYSFGALLLMLLTGKKAHAAQPALDFVRYGVKDNITTEIVDPAIVRNGVTTVEDLQLRASIQLGLLCCAGDADSRPTMVEVATKLKNMITSPELIPAISNFHVPLFIVEDDNCVDSEATYSDVDSEDRTT